ncbi:hypothetical protein MCAV_00410 [[Mycoplasma] cavipharyngis]
MFKELQHLKSVHEDLLTKQKQAELDLEQKVQEYQEAKRIFNSNKIKKI